MIELERHIEILLLSNDCIIVPGLGGFMAHHVDAHYDEAEGLFLPPLRTLGFNPQLRLNDHLLVQSYIEAYDISYPEALRRIEDEVNELWQHLTNEGSYELNDIGVLSMNEEGHLTFEPCEAGILTPSLYGLSTLEMPLLNAGASIVTSIELEKAEDETADAAAKHPEAEIGEQESNNETAITIPMSWLRNAAAIAAAIIAFFFVGTPVSNSNMGAEIEQSSVLPMRIQHAKASPTDNPAQEKKETIADHAEEKVNMQPETLQKSYVIVMASQTSRRHATNFVEQLKKKGYDNVSIIDMSSTSFVRVVYGSYSSEEEAHQQLRSLRSIDRSFAEAWVMNVSR